MTRPAVFSAADIHAALNLKDLREPLIAAMTAVSQQTAGHPPRFAAPVNAQGRMGLMYGHLQDPPVHGAKVLSLFPDAPAVGLSSHQGFVMLFDSRDGRPLAICDADALTALRTAAMSMLATQILARPDPQIITVCGAGEQADWHIRGSLAWFPTAKIRIWARRFDAARQLALTFAGASAQVTAMPDLQQAVRGSDVIHTVTAATHAFLCGDWLEPGQHINLVGASLADSRELDDAGVARVAMFTDSRESSSRESGEILGAKRAGAIAADYPVTEIGQVIENPLLGRGADTDITAYKSHGLIVQDLVAGYEMLKRSGQLPLS
ncbi:ornithine cyclodeaminase family protein [Pseudophaeobacter arcticus]|uniref:ornithine cyclodeaminase family protein n=1 Tax=Pseudophaeobacter arcticus TaxID=385492 RepID=UPI003A976C7A